MTKGDAAERRTMVLEGPVSRLGLTRVPVALFALCLAIGAAIVLLLGLAAQRWIDGRRQARVAEAPRSVDAPLPRGPVAASARSDEAMWIGTDDYPLESIRREEEGTVTITWTIGTDGRVATCGVMVSSGSARLDAAACNAIVKRGRYHPARDATGRPVATQKSRRVSWRLPVE